MINSSPIPSPPPELVREWTSLANEEEGDEVWSSIATQAAQWGSDQELQACINFVYHNMLCDTNFYKHLRAARRPKPPSLKEQALESVKRFELGQDIMPDLDTIRKALEALPND